MSRRDYQSLITIIIILICTATTLHTCTGTFQYRDPCIREFGPTADLDCYGRCCGGTSNVTCMQMSTTGHCVRPEELDHYNNERGRDCAGVLYGGHLWYDTYDPETGEKTGTECVEKEQECQWRDCAGVLCGPNRWYDTYDPETGEKNGSECWTLRDYCNPPPAYLWADPSRYPPKEWWMYYCWLQSPPWWLRTSNPVSTVLWFPFAVGIGAYSMIQEGSHPAFQFVAKLLLCILTVGPIILTMGICCCIRYRKTVCRWYHYFDAEEEKEKRRARFSIFHMD